MLWADKGDLSVQKNRVPRRKEGLATKQRSTKTADNLTGAMADEIDGQDGSW